MKAFHIRERKVKVLLNFLFCSVLFLQVKLERCIHHHFQVPQDTSKGWQENLFLCIAVFSKSWWCASCSSEGYFTGTVLLFHSPTSAAKSLSKFNQFLCWGYQNFYLTVYCLPEMMCYEMFPRSVPQNIYFLITYLTELFSRIHLGRRLFILLRSSTSAPTFNMVSFFITAHFLGHQLQNCMIAK